MIRDQIELILKQRIIVLNKMYYIITIVGSLQPPSQYPTVDRSSPSPPFSLLLKISSFLMRKL